MNRKFRFIWVDGDPERAFEAKNLESRLGVEAEFKNVKNKNLTSELSNILSKPMPDLILMDHKLNDVATDGFKTGSTAAEVIREKWPECPILCVTAVPLTDINFYIHMQSIYEHVFDFDKLSDYDATILSIATSFKRLRERRPKNVDDLIKLIKAPADDEKRLRDILPDNLKKKEAYNDKSLLMMISNWIRHNLMAKPGFLYDRLWAATLIGIKEESFNKVEETFKDAKYAGIFADKGNERWWQTRLREILFSKFPGKDTIYPWEIGRELPGITQADFSKCYASGEDFPETVAYTDEIARERAPMRIRYTIPHPNFEKLLYFEEIRMMKAAE